MTPSILVLNGPNLNLLGTREPEVYGAESLADIKERCLARGIELGVSVDFRQSNSEAELITWIQQARDGAQALILNAAAYTHTSIAILDALRALDIPIYEVHLSNIFRRDSYRHHSFVSLAADGVICGLGSLGYELALEAAARKIVATKLDRGQDDDII